MNKTTNDTANASSMETLWKVLRFIGKYRFLLILSIILAAVSVILHSIRNVRNEDERSMTYCTSKQ